MRAIVVVVHRWLGLAMASFLVVAGLTGAVIAFNHELDERLNPELFRVGRGGSPMSPLELAARLEAAEPRLRVTYVPLEVEHGHALVLGVAARTDPTSGAVYGLGYDEVFLDPVTGMRLGERLWGGCCFERKQLIPFLYSVHYTLHLPETWGLWVMGLIATAWILDGFVGFYLTLPGGAFSWQAWKAAWRVKFGASPYRVNFDLHRAAGLWFWGLLLMMAVTAVSLNLHFEVFRPLLSQIMPVTPSRFDPARATDPVDPLASFSAVVATADEEARKRGWQPPFDVFYSAEFGLFGVGFGDHHAPGTGVPYLYFDRAGTVTGASIPGEGTVGDVVIQWMYPLHSGQIIGLPGRIAICITGLAVALLSITGVVIWAKKRKGRRALARREMLSRSPLPPSRAEVPR